MLLPRLQQFGLNLAQSFPRVSPFRVIGGYGGRLRRNGCVLHFKACARGFARAAQIVQFDAVGLESSLFLFELLTAFGEFKPLPLANRGGCHALSHQFGAISFELLPSRENLRLHRDGRETFLSDLSITLFDCGQMLLPFTGELHPQRLHREMIIRQLRSQRGQFPPIPFQFRVCSLNVGSFEVQAIGVGRQ